MSNELHLQPQKDWQREQQQQQQQLSQQWRHHEDTIPQLAAVSHIESLSLYRLCRERIQGASYGSGVSENAPSHLVASGPLISHSSRHPMGRQLLHMPSAAAAGIASTLVQAPVVRAAAAPAAGGPGPDELAAEIAGGISAGNEAAVAKLRLIEERREGAAVEGDALRITSAEAEIELQQKSQLELQRESEREASPLFQFRHVSFARGGNVQPSGELERWLQKRQESQQSQQDQQSQERMGSPQTHRPGRRAGKKWEVEGEKEEGVVDEKEEEEGMEKGEGNEERERVNKRRRERNEQCEQGDGRGEMDGPAWESCLSPEQLLHSHVQRFKSIRRSHQEKFIDRARKCLKQLEEILIPSVGHAQFPSPVLPSIDDSYVMRQLGIASHLK
ncbi:unnamed protein product [Closterium sp. NIES-54]